MAKRRLVVTVTDEMHKMYKEIAKEKSNTVSGIVRLALHAWAQQQGYDIQEWYVKWGGGGED